jgi:hypothetical protein
MNVIEKMREKDIKATDIAERLGVTRGAVYHAINGKGTRPIRVEVAFCLGESPTELWGTHERHIIDELLYRVKMQNAAGNELDISKIFVLSVRV